MGDKATACVPSIDVDARRAVRKGGSERRYSLNRRVKKEGAEKMAATAKGATEKRVGKGRQRQRKGP
jgi:hypothetical protein